MSNDNISCRIKRSDRPCIVCSGHMDLIEAHPSRFNLFSAALPYMCGGAEGVDCLDCPKCGFKTTTADYQYLHMCKKERQTGAGGSIIPVPESPSYTKKTRGGGDRTSSSTTRSCSSRRQQPQQEEIGNGRRSSSTSNSNNNSNRIRGESTSTTCSHCQASLESSSWQFCPSCGKKCASSSSTTSGTTKTTTTAVKKNEQNNNQGNDEIIKDSIERNDTISASNSCSSSSRSNSNSISNSNSRDSGGIVRMVTPPKRTSTDDYSSPVQMQY